MLCVGETPAIRLFQAVIKAVDQLLVKHGYPEPERHGERFAYLRELKLIIQSPKSARLNSERLGARFGKAHVSCSY
ncbi:hypothetical protein KEJ49_01545 [Candidatus Bathyarchaeota archaeon]|nr:hypothetical protein [Candidatus Bathyarchaeota archaeon]